MKIFAVIVTYNAMRRNWIDRCLESLQKSTVPVTAIVVDNLSSDGTREHIPTHWPNAVWLPQDNNWGFGQANNIGIRYALKHEADYVLLLNQDASLHPEALELLLKETDEQSLMTPAHYNGDGTKLDFMFSRAILKASTELTEENYQALSLLHITSSIRTQVFRAPTDNDRGFGNWLANDWMNCRLDTLHLPVTTERHDNELTFTFLIPDGLPELPRIGIVIELPREYELDRDRKSVV